MINILKIFTISSLFLVLCSTAIGQGNSNTIYVYISTGSGAYAYHKKKDCSRLKRCLEEGHVRKITLHEAQEKGRTPCKVCISIKSVK